MVRIYSAGNLPESPLAQAPKGSPYDVQPAQAAAWVAAGWATLTLPADASPLALERAGQPIPQPGVPVLHGPYVVDFSDIPHDFDTLVLWVPQVGDVVTRVFADMRTITNWSTGTVRLTQAGDVLAHITLGNVAELADVATVCATGDPFEVEWVAGGEPEATSGHVDIFALVARAVTPTP